MAGAINRLMQSAPPDARAPKLLALFGPSGTGKTHLSHGLVRHWNEQRGADCAAYLTASDFYRQLIDAIKRDAVADFRRSLRSHGLLAIDDLHELPDENYVSQELRFTLDAYEESGATIVVTSRRPAATLVNISPDVSSRLAAGLMLQLRRPAMQPGCGSSAAHPNRSAARSPTNLQIVWPMASAARPTIYLAPYSSFVRQRRIRRKVHRPTPIDS